MSRKLLGAGLIVLLLGGAITVVAGRPRAAARPAVVAPAFSNPDDPEGTQATMRYRQCQPHHWRYVMLQK